MLAEEKIERAYELHVKELEDNLIERILQCKPEFFERLVVELLMKMGYGYDRSSGSVVGKSHDGGVDGIINEVCKRNSKWIKCNSIKTNKWS